MLTRIGVEPFREHLLGVLLQHLGKTDVKDLEEPGMEEMCGVRGQSILAFLEWMNEKWRVPGGEADAKVKYSGVEGYLMEELGFKYDDIQKIRGSIELWNA